MPNGETELACRSISTIRGPLSPLHILRPHEVEHSPQDSSKSTLMDRFSTIQQQEDISSATGSENYLKKVQIRIVTSILVVEARALRDGIEAALQSGFTKLSIEGDNLIVIQALTGKSIVPWKIGTIIDDIIYGYNKLHISMLPTFFGKQTWLLTGSLNLARLSQFPSLQLSIFHQR